MWWRFFILSVVYWSLGLTLVVGVRKIREMFSEELAFIVAVIFTPLLISFFLIMVKKIKDED